MLDAAACRALVERFEASGLARRGETGGGVDVSIKDSWDIPLQTGSLLIAPTAFTHTHRSNMYRKLALRNSVELMRFASAHGIGLPLPTP